MNAILIFFMLFQQPSPTSAVDKPYASFHNCRIDGGTGNDPHYQDMSEFYKCDEGRVELKGRWSMTIEYGTVFSTEMGRPSSTPHTATKDDYSTFKWCSDPKPWDKNQKELCGLVPPEKCWDGKTPRYDSTGDWTCVDKSNK